MYFNKTETSNNFVYDSPESARVQVEPFGDNLFRIRVESKRWPRGSDSFAWLDPGFAADRPSTASLKVGTHGELDLTLDGKPILASAPGRGFGVCGSKWIFPFPYRPEDRFYGMGHKSLGLELSRQRTIFWNTDVFADFDFNQIEKGKADPLYASFPVLIQKTRGAWLGFVVNNPHGVFMNTGAQEGIFQPGAGPFVPELFFGAKDGAPDVWIAVDKNPAALVRKLQRLQGTSWLPPLWALGHHQCRWGYKSFQDLERVARDYEERGIPNDGLWLDIDYMDGFRVFTINKEHFPNPAAQIAHLKERGFHVVPILDPGLRRDPAYRIYREARDADILCHTPEGNEFIGYVWPGYTVFPDYSLPEGREFWARQVEDFTRLGFDGYWIDMNDPSTGSVPNEDMVFARGTLPHGAWHNQYALGMAVATDEGQRRARPGERTFTLSRSQFLGSARFTAMWTGDNLSNIVHMRGAIAMTLNLAVSGMPFNGPDVPGFGKDATAELMRAWYKLGFLFPFLRNHNVHDARDQEPWSMDGETEKIVADFIRGRYKVLPYLYQLFLEQHREGSPMLRPVWYHDPSPAFEYVDDMFFVGPSILQAPFVDTEANGRPVTLPVHSAGAWWFDLLAGEFRHAGTTHSHPQNPHSTPLYLACPSVIPMQEGQPRTNRKDLRKIEVVIVCTAGSRLQWRYQADDGHSTAWERGELTELELGFSADGAGDDRVAARIDMALVNKGYGSLELSFLMMGPSAGSTLVVNGRVVELGESDLPWAGTLTKVLRTGWMTLD